MKVLLTVSYVGTNFMGYQLQKDDRTVSLCLNRACEEAFGFLCNVTGCSRTDRGVHATGFKATIEPKFKSDRITVPVEKIPIALNLKLPNDVSVLDASLVDDSFHPRYDVKKKEYVYKIHASSTRNPFLDNLILEFGRTISEESFKKMEEAAKLFVGKHDFSSFMSVGSKIEDCTRIVYESYLVRDGEYVEYHIVANGFLYNMVRIIVGTLLHVALGKISPDKIPEIINGKNRKLAGPTAKPCGLYLANVIY